MCSSGGAIANMAQFLMVRRLLSSMNRLQLIYVFYKPTNLFQLLFVHLTMLHNAQLN